MRTLIRRRSTKRILVSRPEIKQTSDKVNLTVYAFNREKQYLIRKMYFYNRKISQNNLKLQNLCLLDNNSNTRSVKRRFLLRKNSQQKHKMFIHNIILNTKEIVVKNLDTNNRNRKKMNRHPLIFMLGSQRLVKKNKLLLRYNQKDYFSL